MSLVPDSLQAAFYAGERSAVMPHCINDPVSVVVGPFAGRSGAVISIEEASADPVYLVELCDTGEDVMLAASVLELHAGRNV